MGRRLGGLGLVVAATIIACGSDTGPSEEGEIVASLDFEVTPSEIALGDVSCGATKSSSITIKNKGGATIAWTLALPDGSPFTIKAEPSGTLSSGAEATLPIDIAPNIPGDVQDVATIDVNGISQTVALKARGVGAVLVAEPALVDFGEVRFDRAFEKPLAFRNRGNAPAIVDGFEGGADAMTVGPNGVSIEPGATGAFVATVGAGAVTGSSTKTSLTPILNANSAHCGPKPTLDIAALRLNTDVTLSVADFGAQGCGIGGNVTRDVTITNYANQTVTFTAALPASSVFTIAEGAQGTVPAATGATPTTATVKVAMGATGTVLGLHEEALTFQIAPLAPPSGGERTTKVRLDVRGAIITANPMTLKLSSDGKRSDRERVRFTNDGNEPITLRYRIEAQSGVLWLTDATTQVVNANASRDLNVSFLPTRDDRDADFTRTLEVARDNSSQTAVCSPLPQPVLEGHREGSKR